MLRLPELPLELPRGARCSSAPNTARPVFGDFPSARSAGEERAHSDVLRELRRLHDELAELRSEKQRQQEGLRAEHLEAREPQQQGRIVEMDEQSVSTVELVDVPQVGADHLSHQSWMIETLPEELLGFRSDLSDLSASPDRRSAATPDRRSAATPDLRSATPDLQPATPDRPPRPDGTEERAAFKEEVRAAVAEEQQAAQDELRKTRMQLEALLELGQWQGADLKGELLQVRQELVAVRQHSERQVGVQEEVRRSQARAEAERDQLAQLLQEQNYVQAGLQEEVTRVRGLLDAAEASHAQKAHVLEAEVASLRQALEAMSEEKTRQSESFQNELSGLRSELAAAKSAVKRQPQARSHSRQAPQTARASTGSYKPAWAQHPPSLPPPPARRSCGCQVDLRDDGAAALARELEQARAERDELVLKMEKQKSVQEAILHTCQELEAGYMATKRQHQELRGEIRRVCSERDRALRKLSGHVEEENTSFQADMIKQFGLKLLEDAREAEPNTSEEREPVLSPTSPAPQGPGDRVQPRPAPARAGAGRWVAAQEWR